MYSGQRCHFIFKLFVEDETKLLTRLIFEFGSPNEFTFTQVTKLNLYLGLPVEHSCDAVIAHLLRT
jgi:hypothetical protein